MDDIDRSDPVGTLPDLDEMLQSLLLIEEGEHEFVGDDDVQELRHLFFPATRECIYLNHASNGPLPRPVVRTIQEYLEDYSKFGGSHEVRWNEHAAGAHRRVAAMIEARPDQIALTANTGDGLLLVASGLDWQPGDRVIVAEGEFPSNIYPWLNLQEQGVKIHFVPARQGCIDAQEVCETIDERTRLVSLSLVEFGTGYRNDIATIARHCHERGVLCGIDAMQAVGALDVNVRELDVDYLSSGSHKWLLSAKTCGIFYVSDNLLPQLRVARRNWLSIETPFDFFNYQQPLKAGAARFEYSSSNQMAIVGLDAALGLFEALEGGMQAVEQRVLGLTDYAITGLELLGYPVTSPRGQGQRSGIICFQPHPEQKAEQMVANLADKGIYVAPRNGIIRISPHFYNTIEDIDTLLNALEDRPMIPANGN